jgi:hypothetical protein
MSGWCVPDVQAKPAEVTAAGATVEEPAHDVGGGRVLQDRRVAPPARQMETR